MTEKKICRTCELKKPIEDFTQNKDGSFYSVCKMCQRDNRKNYEEGINADLSSVAPHSRSNILAARELLELMGYDLKQDIYDQFRERTIQRQGVDVENPPKRRKGVFRRFP